MRTHVISVFLAYSSIILFFSGCSTKKRPLLTKYIYPYLTDNSEHILMTNTDIKQPVVTIWIHGTRIIRPFGPFKRLLYSKEGLHPAASYYEKYRMRRIAHTLCKHNPELFSYEHFYIFGWPGTLSFEARAEQAHVLYTELCKLHETYIAQYGVRPYIRIISHSHGGNVALNMAYIPDKDPHIVVNELVLLACPVQDYTKTCITDPMFKHIYAIYSHLDIIQIADPQGAYRHTKNRTSLFSKRYFPDQPNLEQVRIKINGRALFHTDFVAPRLLQFLGSILHTMKKWHHESDHIQETNKMIHVRTKNKRGHHFKKAIMPSPHE